jgi:hypothetical protein
MLNNSKKCYKYIDNKALQKKAAWGMSAFELCHD